MRFTFTILSLIALSQAITLPVNEFDQIDEEPENKAIEAAQHAQKLLKSADTKEDFKAISHPFQSIEASVDTKITNQRKNVEGAVDKVQDLNKQADDAIEAAKEAVTKKGKAGEAKIDAQKTYADAVKAVESDVKQANDQDTAIKTARNAKEKAIQAQEKATKAVKAASDQIAAA